MRSSRWITATVAAMVATLLIGVAAPAHADTLAYSADTCAKAKAKVKKAKKKVKKAKSVGGKKLKKANKKLKKAKKAKRQACGTSGGDGNGLGWLEGRYQGTYAENNVDLAFNVVGNRLFTGPFDGFYLYATCRNVDPDYTGDLGLDDSSGYEPVQATIAADGSFSGQGVYRTGYTDQPWTISGRIAGGSVTGQFSSRYTNTYGNPCNGTTRFTAEWYGDYTL
jgi:hypothetical protein